MKLHSPHLFVGVSLIALALRIASSPTANASYALIACYALLGRAQAIQALALSWLFSMMNSGIAPEATLASIGRYAVLAAAGLSTLLRSGVLRGELKVSPPVLATFVLGCLVVIHSMLFSAVADVSVLKAISWTLAASTTFSAWSGMARSERTTLQQQIKGGFVVLLLASLPFLGTELGYMRNGTGFQGVLGHPQALGMTMAISSAWFGSQVLSAKKPTWWALALFGLSVALIVLSEARTAGGAMIASFVLASAVACVVSRRAPLALLPGLRSPRIYIVLSIATVAAMLSASTLPDSVQQFVMKRQDAGSIAEAYQSSRGGLVDQMTSNIAQHPLTGIGFGIASFPEDMVVERDPWLGWPTGAAIEKGVLPIAVAEELGVPGFIAVSIWLWVLLARAARGANIGPLWVLFVALVLNLGESVLFSPGGMGLLSLIVIGWAITDRPERAVGREHGYAQSHA